MRNKALWSRISSCPQMHPPTTHPVRHVFVGGKTQEDDDRRTASEPTEPQAQVSSRSPAGDGSDLPGGQALCSGRLGRDRPPQFCAFKSDQLAHKTHHTILVLRPIPTSLRHSGGAPLGQTLRHQPVSFPESIRPNLLVFSSHLGLTTEPPLGSSWGLRELCFLPLQVRPTHNGQCLPRGQPDGCGRTQS